MLFLLFSISIVTTKRVMAGVVLNRTIIIHYTFQERNAYFGCWCRLVGDAWIIDPSSGSCPGLISPQHQGQHSRPLHMLLYKLLPYTRTRKSIWWLQELIYKEPWSFQLPRSRSYLDISYLVHDLVCYLDFKEFVSCT